MEVTNTDSAAALDGIAAIDGEIQVDLREAAANTIARYLYAMYFEPPTREPRLRRGAVLRGPRVRAA